MPLYSAIASNGDDVVYFSYDRKMQYVGQVPEHLTFFQYGDMGKPDDCLLFVKPPNDGSVTRRSFDTCLKIVRHRRKKNIAYKQAKRNAPIAQSDRASDF